MNEFNISFVIARVFPYIPLLISLGTVLRNIPFVTVSGSRIQTRGFLRFILRKARMAHVRYLIKPRDSAAGTFSHACAREQSFKIYREGGWDGRNV